MDRRICLDVAQIIIEYLDQWEMCNASRTCRLFRMALRVYRPHLRSTYSVLNHIHHREYYLNREILIVEPDPRHYIVNKEIFEQYRNFFTSIIERKIARVHTWKDITYYDSEVTLSLTDDCMDFETPWKAVKCEASNFIPYCDFNIERFRCHYLTPLPAPLRHSYMDRMYFEMYTPASLFVTNDYGLYTIEGSIVSYLNAVM